MSEHQFTRRDALRTAVAGLPLLAGTSIAGGDTPKDPRSAGTIPIGIATLGFRDRTNAELAAELQQAGIRIVQLFLSQSDSNFWRYNGRNDVSEMTPERCKAIGDTYRQAGITIDSIGVYTNLIHPDAEEREANLAYFDAMMKVGQHMGVDTFITEAGHYHPEKLEPGPPYDFRGATWDVALQTFKQLGAMAQKNEAKVLVEPFFQGFFASAKRTRVFLEELDCPRIRVLLDPANLIELNTLDEMFAQLTPWIDCLHAKDRKLHSERGVAAGKGDLDYVTFVRLAAQYTPGVPLILEYVDATTYQAARDHLRRAIHDAGLQYR